MPISEELRKRVAQLEAEQKRQEEDVSKLTTVKQETVTPKKTTKGSKEGFFVKLFFSDNAPISEWSDETHGWRTAGLGTRYPNRQSAEKKLAELKEKWPNYPLHIGESKKT